MVANCQYGSYNGSDGTVSWSGSGTVVLEYFGGTITLVSTTGFPSGWTFSDPKMQGDGSWIVTLDGGILDSWTISSLVANPDAIVDDGISASVITATVVDNNNQPAAGVTVNWSTTLGTVSPQSSVTAANGTANTTLTDYGAPGIATVTATLASSDNRSVPVTVTEPASVNMYCSTGAPLNSGMLAAVQPTNKVALYGTPGADVTLTVTGNARFTSNSTSSTNLTLGADGYALAEVYDSLAESVTVNATSSGAQTSAVMAFSGASDKGAVYVNSMTPADNRTPGTLYWWDYQTLDVTSVSLSLSGNAHFANGAKTGTFSLNARDGAVAIDIYDAFPETVTATLSPDSPYYLPSTENMTFISYQTKYHNLDN